MVEFVSANPTGPLHVGHGRQAALGDAIANLLQWQGAQVTREFYYNDAGAADPEPRDLGARARAGDPRRARDVSRGRLSRRVHPRARAALPRRGRPRPRRHRARSAGSPSPSCARSRMRDLAAFGVAFDNYYLESSLYDDGPRRGDRRAARRIGQDLRAGRRAVAEDHRLRRRQGPRDAQVRRRLHVFRARRRLSRDEVGARLRQGDQRAGLRPSQHRRARARRAAGARARHSRRAIRTTCCTRWCG